MPRGGGAVAGGGGRVKALVRLTGEDEEFVSDEMKPAWCPPNGIMASDSESETNEDMTCVNNIT